MSGIISPSFLSWNSKIYGIHTPFSPEYRYHDLVIPSILHMNLQSLREPVYIIQHKVLCDHLLGGSQ